MRPLNIDNLKRALSDIQKKITNGEPMNLTSICEENHLGDTTMRKLKFALLEYEYQIPKSDKPLHKMRVKRDKKTWEFIFRHADGSPRPYVLVNDIDDILYAMSQCPKEQANPSYYRKAEDSMEQLVHNETTGESSEQHESLKVCYTNNLQEISDDELTNMLFVIQKEFDRRAEIREKRARLQQVLELAEISKDELKELLSI